MPLTLQCPLERELSNDQPAPDQTRKLIREDDGWGSGRLPKNCLICKPERAIMVI